MKENLIHYRTCVCNINYHMVWSVKYRRKILSAEVEAYLQELVQEIAEDKGFTVHLFECEEGDHVHCFVSAPPKLSITAIVKYLKGISGRKLSDRFHIIGMVPQLPFPKLVSYFRKTFEKFPAGDPLQVFHDRSYG